MLGAQTLIISHWAFTEHAELKGVATTTDQLASVLSGQSRVCYSLFVKVLLCLIAKRSYTFNTGAVAAATNFFSLYPEM